MPVEFACQCGKRFRLDDSMAGKQGRCAACGVIVAAPPIPPVVAVPSRPASGARNGLERDRAVVTTLIALVLAAGGCFASYQGWKAFRGKPGGVPGIASAKPAVPLPPTIRPIAKVGRVSAPGAGVLAPIASVAEKPPMVADLRPLATDEIVARCEGAVAVIRGPESSGSGFVVGPGLVATNAHVVRRIPESSIRVSFPAASADRMGPHAAQVLHFDDGRDLAILAVPITPPPLPIAEGQPFRRGQDVVFMGSPGLGSLTLENVASRGVLGSQVRIDDLDYYQLSGSVNPGNSGGPVLDTAGRVVAVVTARARKEEGIGLCVPMTDLAKAVRAASARDPGRTADARERHEASARLASVISTEDGRIGDPKDQFASDFLRKTEPATWLAAIDANLILKDSSPRVVPFRQRLKRADAIYVEDDRVIAGMLIQSVVKVKDAGLPISCATLLESSLRPGQGVHRLNPKPLSFLDFCETYIEIRINERLGHRETVHRMETDPRDRPASVRADPPNGNPKPTAAPKPAANPAPKLTGPGSPAGRLEAAKRLEAENSINLAVAAYQNLIEKFPLTMEAGIAKNRIKVLRPDPAKSKSLYDPNKIVPRG